MPPTTRVVDAVVALAPSHVAWANVGPGPDGELRPQHSSWSRSGEPVPFVPYDDDAEPVGDPPAFAPVYAQSLRTARRPGRRQRRSPSSASSATCCSSRAATTGCGRR